MNRRQFIKSASLLGLAIAIPAPFVKEAKAVPTAKAFATFDGTKIVPNIISSYNVKSVRKNGRGNYTIEFEAPIRDVNCEVKIV